MEKVSISWSGGKDCTLALYKILQQESYEVVSLHATIDYNSKKVGLHGVHEALLDKQAQLLNIPLEKIYLNDLNNNHSYEDLILGYYEKLNNLGIQRIISGDIFLEDLRVYKESLSAKKGIEIEFPLWGKPTRAILQEFINEGFKTLICAADADIFSPEDIGKTIDLKFLENLPENLDPCGENGEFHTFTYDGPIFPYSIDFDIKDISFESHSFSTKEGKRVVRRFYYAELSS